MATNRRRSIPESVTSLSQFRRFERVVSTQKPSRKVCGASLAASFGRNVCAGCSGVQGEGSHRIVMWEVQVIDPGQPCDYPPGYRSGEVAQPPSGRIPYLFLDAYDAHVREDGQVRDLAVLTAVGVNQEGKREILSVSVSMSEHEVHWRTLLESLKARGLGGVQLITSDDHAGLRAARLAVFGAIPWQRCQFHLQQNA